MYEGQTLDWSHKILRRAEPWLGRPKSPLVLKELAWRVINWVINCGKSNPISFALRPIAMSAKLRVAIGINLALLVLGMGILGPLPIMADNTGGPMSLLATLPEISVSTHETTQIPLKKYHISQGFWALHSGIDMASDTGEPIRAIMPGVVSKVEKNWFGYGNMVMVKHSDEYESLYAHMSKTLVSVGQIVDNGTVLGLVGSTGRSTGPHLHLEVYENGKIINPAIILGIPTK